MTDIIVTELGSLMALGLVGSGRNRDQVARETNRSEIKQRYEWRNQSGNLGDTTPREPWRQLTERHDPRGNGPRQPARFHVYTF